MEIPVCLTNKAICSYYVSTTCDFRMFWIEDVHLKISKSSRPGCSKLTTSLVNMSLKFQTLISQISRYFLLKSHFLLFFQQKISVYLVIKS